jgi:hypothetical protein
MVTAQATSFSNAYVLTLAKAWLSASAGHLTAVAVVAQTIGGAKKNGLSLWTLQLGSAVGDHLDASNALISQTASDVDCHLKCMRRQLKATRLRRSRFWYVTEQNSYTERYRLQHTCTTGLVPQCDGSDGFPSLHACDGKQAKATGPALAPSVQSRTAPRAMEQGIMSQRCPVLSSVKCVFCACVSRLLSPAAPRSILTLCGPAPARCRARPSQGPGTQSSSSDAQSHLLQSS